MAEATYFHATLYKFNDAARKEVVVRFNNAVNDIAARCWYDEGLDMFELHSPGNIGATADEKLAEIIAKYVEDELAAADRQDRGPNVERFAQSSFDDMFTDEANGAPRDMPAQTGSAPRVLTLHLINVEGASRSQKMLKWFKLSELPTGLIERVLADPSDQQQTKMITSGFTCRAVLGHGPGRAAGKFNGRVGQPIPRMSQADEDAFLAKAPFYTLVGTSMVAEPDPKVMHFNVKGANVNQWRHGMGEVEFFDPNERPVMPKDAVKMLVSDQLPGLGRARVPIGTQPFAADSDDESVTDKPASSKTTNFAALLGTKATGDSESETSEAPQKSDSDSEETASGGKSGFLFMLGSKAKGDGSPARKHSIQQERVVIDQRPMLRVRNSTPLEQQPVDENTVVARRIQTPDESAAVASSIAPTNELDSYGRDWASVDTIGLSARAESQAIWNLEHPSPRRTPRRSGMRSGIQLARRGQHPDTPEESGQVSRPPPPVFQSPSVVPGNTVGRSITQSTERPAWEDIIVRPAPPEGMLVDDTAFYATSTPTRLPPGLGPPPSSRPAQRSAVVEGDPIGVGDPNETQWPKPSKPPARPPGFTGRVLIPEPASTEAVMRQLEDDDTIEERLQVPKAEAPKKFTMRQKAAKKGKGKGKGTIKMKGVQLPLPDPVPPPRKLAPKPRADDDMNAPNSRQPSTAQHDSPFEGPIAEHAVDTPMADMSLDSPMASIETATKIPTQLEALQSMIAEAALMQPDLHLEARFASCLLSLDDKLLQRDTIFTAQSFSPDFTLATLPITRLTPSTSDAKYVLELVEDASPALAQAYYEFQLRDTAGQRRTVTCGSDAGLRPSDDRETIATAYVQFPFRVWDAQFIVTGPPEQFAKDAVAQLFQSMTTIDTSPSFYAKVPNVAFAVEKVFAKREYYRIADRGPRIVVTEVLDLQLESLNEPSANLKATCASRESMEANQRLWWEAKIVAKDVEDIEVLHELVGTMLPQMDGVGYHNKGPWEPRSMVQTTEVAGPASMW
ncbi:hypothetical protein LTR56_013430 [Elasticomyces elasticus]|nr:hypothetical protein LTR22_025167 [Elasticomyces elasticus]KAK3637827.1 hypothetical protein LTR56_013430 [Elasticomyces elasticus]KAK4905065.1 hypothetical protein LTR49_025593 [Elasticomyces elasticus]KAK5753890.1 hypothetical protein LTS12_015982 [Elasticomyces elasticus]